MALGMTCKHLRFLISRRLASLRVLAFLAMVILFAGCPHLIDVRYVPSVAPSARRPQSIDSMQVGTFLGEELFEFTPTFIAETGKSTVYRLPVPAPEFIRQAFLAELEARGIRVVPEGKRVAGELVRFEFPCQEQATNPSTRQCSMRFRFAVRNHGRVVFEKHYEQSLTFEMSEGVPEEELVKQAFGHLLARTFRGFLEDPAVVSVFNTATPAPIATEGSTSVNAANVAAAEGRGLQRKLKNNRVYFEVFGRAMLMPGVFYDRKVLEYGYVGLGATLFPGGDPSDDCDPKKDPCGSGGIWIGPLVGINSPNLLRSRAFFDLGVVKEVAGSARPTGISMNYSLGLAFQFTNGFDLQIGCTRFVPMILDTFCMPRFDLGTAW